MILIARPCLLKARPGYKRSYRVSLLGENTKAKRVIDVSLKRTYAFVCQVEAIIAKTTLFLMVMLVCIAGIMRSIGYPLNWAVDMATFLFGWSCFLSADIAWRENKLITVDIFIKGLSKKTKWYLRMINYVLIAVFLVYLIVFGIWLSYTTRARTFQGIPGFSYTWVTLSLPVGALLMLITTVLKVKSELGSKAEV